MDQTKYIKAIEKELMGFPPQALPFLLEYLKTLKTAQPKELDFVVYLRKIISEDQEVLHKLAQ